MKKLILSLSLVFAAIASHAQIPAAFANHLQYLLDSACAKNKIKGVSAAVLIPGMGVWKGSYGVSHDKLPITTETWLPIGSNTKTFTTAIMLQLQQEGKLSLDDSIGKWIQNVPNVNGQITIRQMLNHTSGLYNFTNNPAFSAALNADFTKFWQPEDDLPFISTPSFAPGAGWEYSNSGFILAGMIISKVLNEPYHEALIKRILTPRNYQKTVLFPQQALGGTVPHGWSVAASGGTKLEDIQVEYAYDITAFQSMAHAAGAIISTAEDNVHFWDDLMTGKIVNTTSLNEMMTTVTTGGSFRYGLGMFRYNNVNGRVGYCHGGTCFGYINENFRDSLSGICITLLSNQDSIGNNLLFQRVLVPLHRYLIKLPAADIAGINPADNIKIYPNPAKDVVNISLSNLSGKTNIMIYDMAGRNVLNTPAVAGNNTLSVSSLSPGTYILRVMNEGLIMLNYKLEIAP